MLNSDKIDINYQISNKNWFSINGCDYSPLSWRNDLPQFSNIMNNNCPINSQNDSEDDQLFSAAEINKDESESRNIVEPRVKLRPPKFSKPKIKMLKIKALMTRETLNSLPSDIRQHLISLMPDCDKVFTGEPPEERAMCLSKTALNNEFFDRALMRFLWKLTNGKSILSTESLIKRIKSFPSTKLLPINSISAIDENIQKPKIIDIPQSNSSTIRLDYDINDAKVNYNFGVESPVFVSNRESENELNIKREYEASSPSYSFDSSFLFNIGTGANSLNTLNNSEFETIQKDFADVFSNHSLQPILSPISDSVISPGSSKYKRRNSGNNLAPSPNKRPTRSTAGQLPARLKSSSPEAGIQGTIISALLNRSHSPTINKPIPGRKKNTEKRKHKNNENNTNNINHNNVYQETKPSSFHNDTILLNLRTKLSNRIQKNSLKDYQDHCSRSDSILDFPSEINCFNQKSPNSLSPESDKAPFVNSPLSKNGHNNLRHLKYKNPYFENQTPTSPQWSFSSEFTSQSSVESVLSQKNIRIDLDDVATSENLLDDMDSEEMPPPRRTLTVAAMREKMRAKKMAKEEKRKDFDKDFTFDTDKLEDSKNIDISGKHCHSSVMSSMMGMSRDNEDNEEDNIANEFDSFLIDDYHVEIDDKILNYSDDLDDLLLSGGNESLLEIIMKDPDAMDIENESFSTLNSECQHRNPIVSSDQILNCSFSNNINQSQCNAFNNYNTEMSTAPSTINHKPTVPVSSVCRIDNSILSQALTSVIQKVDNNKSNSKDSSAIKSALQNAYLVDGNGLSDALKLIQSLHPEAKVTTQQFYLVNSGPQLVLSQAPPTQASSSRPVNVQSPTKPTPSTIQIASQMATSAVTSIASRCSDNSNKTNNSTPPVANTLIFTNTKPSTSLNQSPILSSTLSVLPQFSAFNSKSSNIYSLNSNFTNKLVNPLGNLGCKISTNNIQYQTIISTAAPSSCSQQLPLFTTQKPLTSNLQNSQNTIGIQLQLAQNFSNGQQLNIIQPSQAHVIPTLMNQPLQFISPQHNNNGNISLITQTQPMSKLVLLYPNFPNCSQISSDSLKTDSQQVILLSQKDQSTPISLSTAPTFQVLNGANIWQQINPNLNSLLGSSNANNLVLMNPQHLNNQSFSFNYHQPLLMMSTTNATQGQKTIPINNQRLNQNKIVTAPTSSLSINVTTKPEEDKPLSVPIHLNSNSSQNSCVEQLSNSSSSANSKLSFDDKSSCQLSKSQSDNLTDSDQEKSISSPNQFNQIFNNHRSSSSSKSVHLTVDIDSLSPTSNSFYHRKMSQNDDRHTNQSPDSDYEQSEDFEIPCLYSRKLETSRNENMEEEEDFDR